MPQEHQQRRTPRTAHETEPQRQRTKDATAAFDAVLDEIDAVLQSDAEAFVKSFVQKGGQ